MGISNLFQKVMGCVVYVPKPGWTSTCEMGWSDFNGVIFALC